MRSLHVDVPLHPEPAKRVTARTLWKAKAYAAFKAAATLLIRSAARGRKLDTPCSITTRIWAVSERADLDNLHKGGMDAAVLSGVIPDDNCKYVRAIHSYFLKAEVGEERMVIELESL